MNNFNSENFFSDFISDMTAANLQACGDMSIIEFANRIIFNNDESFQLYPTQKAILKSFYNEPLTEEELTILNGWADDKRTTWVKDRNYISLVLEAGRRASKAVELSALINTPNGYKEYKDIHIGDYVFAVDGTPTKVLDETEVFYDKKCYKLYFQNGEEITCSADHEWFTWTKAARKAYQRSQNPTIHPSVKTTQEIVDTLLFNRHDNKVENNHSINLAKPLQLPEQDLLIHPYCLGLWLGDGHYKSSMITSSQEDIEIVRNRFHELGYDTYLKEKDSYPYRFYSKRLSNELQILGIKNNKEKSIPNNYLLGSINQRLELLRGLMDSDGHSDLRGRAYFTNTNNNLSTLVYRLALSLGCAASKTYNTGAYKNKEGVKIICKDYVQVSLRPQVNPFYLPRKAERYKPCLSQNNKRFIVKAEEVKSVPVKCITIEHPSHLFLIGEELIPTHNCNSESADIITTLGTITVKELHERLSNKEKVGIYTYDIESNIARSFITYDIKTELNAVEQTYLITTETGKTEIVNCEHPFLTIKKDDAYPSWVKLKDLKEKQYIATSSEIPVFGDIDKPAEQLKLWALALSNKVTNRPKLYQRYYKTLHQAFNTIEFEELDECLKKYRETITKEDIGSLSKNSTIIFLRHLLEINTRRETRQGRISSERYYKEGPDICEVTIETHKFRQDIATQFLKLGISSYFLEEPSKNIEGISICNTNSINKLIEIFGWDIYKGREYLESSFANRNLTEGGHTINTKSKERTEDILENQYPLTSLNKIRRCKCRKTDIAKIAIEKNDSKLYDWATNNINWEKITSIKPYKVEQTIAIEVKDTHVIGNPIISHNSTMASIIALKEFYDLITVESPQKKYGILESSPIAILVMAQSQAQVKETIFAAMRGYAENSRFFMSLQNRGEIEILSEEIRCKKKNVAIFAKHTNSKSLVGYTVKAMILDEVARFESVGDDGRNKAFEIWDNVGAGSITFGNESKKVAISSAWEPNDPIEVLYNIAQKNPSSLAFKLTTFQINLDIKKESKVIQSEYINDFVKARREFEGIRFTKFNTFIEIENLNRACRAVSIIDSIPSQIESVTSAGTQYYAGLTLERITPNQINDSLSFIHVDPALKKDSAALAIARPIQEDGKWKIQIDALLKWEPHTDNKGNKRIVSFIDIENKLFDICKVRKVSRITFDQWNCLNEDSRIVTPDGLKLVKNLQKDDLVISRSGINKVVQVKRKEEVPTLKITTKNGYEVEGTYNHPILSKDNNFIKLQDVKINDKVKLYIPETQEVEKQPITKQEHEALVLGYLIAEGDWINNYIRFTNSEKEVINDYTKSYTLTTEKQPNKYTRKFNNPKYKEGVCICKGDKLYYQKLTQELDLQTGAFNKKLPEYIFTASKKEIGLMLSGLYEGDGNITCFVPTSQYKKQSPRIHVELTTVSEQLSKDVQQILLHLGIKSNRKKQNRKTPAGQNTFYYRVLIYGQNLIKFKQTIGFRSSRKQDLLNKAISHLSFVRKSRVNYPEDTIVKIEATTSTIIHMEVSGDHTYCSEFINHNSAAIIQKLNSQGIDAQQVSCSREMQFTYYTLFRDLLAHDYIVLPKDSIWTGNAITELSELVLKSNKQIVHPNAGKDLADAIVNAIYQCNQYMIKSGLNLTTGLNSTLVQSAGLAPLQKITVSKFNTSNLKIGGAIDKLYKKKF